MITKEPTKKQLEFFVLGIDIIALLWIRKAIIQKQMPLAYLLLLFVGGFTFLFFAKNNFVVKFYKGWMRIAAILGIVVNTILMTIIFYGIFTPIGIFFRIIRKDILNLKFDKEAYTYWIDKPQKEFKKEDCLRQF